MPTLKGIYRLVILALAATCIAPLSALGQQSNSSQATDANVTFHLNCNTSSACPLPGARLLLDGKEIQFDTPVPVQGMWLRTLSLVLRNGFSKTITRYQIDIQFPEANRVVGNGPAPTLTLTEGKVSSHAFMRRDGSMREPDQSAIPDLAVPSGKSFTVVVRGGDVRQIQATQLVGKILEVEIVLSSFEFSDGSRWMIGNYYIPAPPPTRFQQVTRTEFNAFSTAAGK